MGNSHSYLFRRFVDKSIDPEGRILICRLRSISKINLNYYSWKPTPGKLNKFNVAQPNCKKIRVFSNRSNKSTQWPITHSISRLNYSVERKKSLKIEAIHISVNSLSTHNKRKFELRSSCVSASTVYVRIKRRCAEKVTKNEKEPSKQVSTHENTKLYLQ